MLKWAPAVKAESGCKILCLGSHCDDIEIGCGGTVLSLIEQVSAVDVYWVVFSSDKGRAAEARESAEVFLKGARTQAIAIKKCRNSFFPFVGVAIKEYFEQLKQEFSPDVIFTHYREDLHQDHRLISHLTWNTFRNDLILEYEIPKYDGDLGSPNVFAPLEEPICRRKIEYLMRCFKSQQGKQWFDEETFWGLLRLRGMECNAPSRYAEAFYCRKVVLGWNRCQ